MATALRNLSSYDATKVPDASNMCFGIVVSEWNPESKYTRETWRNS